MEKRGRRDREVKKKREMERGREDEKRREERKERGKRRGNEREAKKNKRGMEEGWRRKEGREGGRKKKYKMLHKNFSKKIIHLVGLQPLLVFSHKRTSLSLPPSLPPPSLSPYIWSEGLVCGISWKRIQFELAE